MSLPKFETLWSAATPTAHGSTKSLPPAPLSNTIVSGSTHAPKEDIAYRFPQGECSELLLLF